MHTGPDTNDPGELQTDPAEQPVPQDPSGESPENTQPEKPKKKTREPVRISLFSAILLAVILCLITFLTVFAILGKQHEEETAKLNARISRFSKLETILDSIETKYAHGAEESDLMEEAYHALFDGLDSYSYYMSSEEYNEFASDRSGSYAGVGMNVVPDPETQGIYIYRVLPGSPAEQAGIAVGDIVVRVGSLTVNSKTYEEAISSVAGEPDTPVSLTLLRNGSEFTVEVIRGTVESRAVWYEKLENGVAYIEITGFSGSYVVDQFKEALGNAAEDKCTAYVFDVRDNPGGDLNVITSILDLLLPEGPIVNIVSNGIVQRTISSDAEQTVQAPMAVLCNSRTASAAELFTADLRDYELAVLVGETTYGKGTVQSIFPCSDGSAYKMTTSYYTPASGTGYDGEGITPDAEVSLSDDPNANRYRMDHASDRQLQEALRRLTSSENE